MEYKSYSLFLDDIRYPKQVTWVELPLVEWTIVRNFDEFVAYIKVHGCPTRISFDHDLGPEHYHYDWSGSDTCSSQLSGYDCVKWLVEYCEEHNHKFPEYYLHTMNDIGLANMRSYIESYKKTKEPLCTNTPTPKVANTSSVILTNTAPTIIKET